MNGQSDLLQGLLQGRVGSLGWLATVAALYLVVVAFLVGRFAPEQRRFLRLSIFFFLFYLSLSLTAGVLQWFGVAAWPERLRAVALFFLEAQFIHLTAMVVFFLALPRARIDIPDILRDVIVGAAYFIALWSLLRHFGVEVWSLLATTTVASIVVGVSLQPTLASIFGGIAMQFDGSVREGDWVRLTDGQEGRVREIRWRHTVVETRNGDTLVVPNSQLMQQQLLVLGRREGQRLQHRMWVYFQVDARVSPERVVEVVVEALRDAAIENVSANPRPDCVCLSLDTSATSGAARYGVRYWLTDLSRDDPTSSLVIVRVHTALLRAGIALAQPARRISMIKEGTKALISEQREERARRVALLDRVELFDLLQPAEPASLAEKLRPAPFCKGEAISRQGADAHWLYILVSGTAESRVRLPSGVERIIGEVKAPDIFGEFGLLTGAPRRETVVATSRVECLRLDKADLRELMVERPELAQELSNKLAERQQRFDQMLADMGEPAPPRGAGAQSHLFASIQRFFGLADDDPPSRASRGLSRHALTLPDIG